MSANPNPVHDQLKDLFSKSHASGEKLDYFMCGVAGALFAYMGQTFAPDKLPFYACAATIVSLALLTVAFCFAYLRIQSQNNFTRNSQKEIATHDEIQKMFKAISESERIQSEGMRLTLTNELGEPCTLDQLKAEKKEKEAELATYKAFVKNDLGSYANFGISRDILIALGFGAILTAKILQWIGI